MLKWKSRVQPRRELKLELKLELKMEQKLKMEMEMVLMLEAMLWRWRLGYAGDDLRDLGQGRRTYRSRLQAEPACDAKPVT